MLLSIKLASLLCFLWRAGWSTPFFIGGRLQKVSIEVTVGDCLWWDLGSSK